MGLEIDALGAHGKTAKSVSRSSRQRPASEGWCGTPPCSVSLVVSVADCEEDEALALAAAAVRARFGAIAGKQGVGDNEGTNPSRVCGITAEPRGPSCPLVFSAQLP